MPTTPTFHVPRSGTAQPTAVTSPSHSREFDMPPADHPHIPMVVHPEPTQRHNMLLFSYGTTSYGPPADGSAAYGPTSYSSASYGPTAYGSSAWGPAAYDSSAYGSSAHGSSAHGSSAYDSSAYGSSAYSLPTYGPQTYGPASYGPASYYPTAYGPLAYNPHTYHGRTHPSTTTTPQPILFPAQSTPYPWSLPFSSSVAPAWLPSPRSTQNTTMDNEADPPPSYEAVLAADATVHAMEVERCIHEVEERRPLLQHSPLHWLRSIVPLLASLPPTVEARHPGSGAWNERRFKDCIVEILEEVGRFKGRAERGGEEWREMLVLGGRVVELCGGIARGRGWFDSLERRRDVGR